MEATSKLENQALRLEQEVRDCIAAEQLLNFEAGQVLIRWLTARVNVHIKDLTGSKFKKDHTGYIETLAQLEEDKFLLRKIQIASNEDVKHKLNTQLAEVKEAIKDVR